MPYVYVYSPVSGSVTQDDHDGCDSSGSQAIDMGTNWVDVRLYLDSWYFKSIYVSVEYDCCTPSDEENYRRLVKVKLYNQPNQAGYVGFVGFGHTKNVAISGAYNVYGNNFGKICETHLTGCICQVCDSGCCYTGAHLHVETYGGTNVVSYGQALTAGSTAIYRWVGAV